MSCAKTAELMEMLFWMWNGVCPRNHVLDEVLGPHTWRDDKFESEKESQSGCLPYFHTWCGLSANLECRSEMCCTRLTGHRGRKNDAKNRHLSSIAQLCWAISSQL